mmetsp:Transcript_28047/g.84056  ORF Transcript_28047/g.84056 Transcript_28047/m.84056 type:complete len:209 (-) Transcript_28047:143-769(-)
MTSTAAAPSAGSARSATRSSSTSDAATTESTCGADRKAALLRSETPSTLPSEASKTCTSQAVRAPSSSMVNFRISSCSEYVMATSASPARAPAGAKSCRHSTRARTSTAKLNASWSSPTSHTFPSASEHSNAAKQPAGRLSVARVVLARPSTWNSTPAASMATCAMVSWRRFSESARESMRAAVRAASERRAQNMIDALWTRAQRFFV